MQYASILRLKYKNCCKISNVNNAYSYSLVFLQFLLIGLLVIASSLKNLGIISVLFIVLGIVLGVWSILVMSRRSTLRITPDVAKNATLIESGPYKIIRHPMYSAVLLTSFGISLIEINFYKAILFLILFVILFLKIRYEEIQLEVHFKEYGAYKNKTFKLIPYIY